MNKTQLIKQVSEVSGISIAEVKHIADVTIDVIADAIEEWEVFEIEGFHTVSGNHIKIEVNATNHKKGIGGAENK
ncbi:MAG: HU family DNA-binding protein [Tannerellaceae bacterium]|jgi:nucleoid DNA-binding protein|nr:HU family DNA-binding protein [Tannerellaceae bacterium]